ncbi:hypothetical protein AGMMS50267_16100 [Spirochaetia bacterium]|nr:hypothetical protein AGMMS50267_16100 [Spirochaetia bacterium]
MKRRLCLMFLLIGFVAGVFAQTKNQQIWIMGVSTVLGYDDGQSKITQIDNIAKSETFATANVTFENSENAEYKLHKITLNETMEWVQIAVSKKTGKVFSVQAFYWPDGQYLFDYIGLSGFGFISGGRNTYVDRASGVAWTFDGDNGGEGGGRRVQYTVSLLP